MKKLSSNTHDLNDLKSVLPADDPVTGCLFREKRRADLPPSGRSTKTRRT
jgi:hypothetical protein